MTPDETTSGGQDGLNAKQTSAMERYGHIPAWAKELGIADSTIAYKIDGAPHVNGKDKQGRENNICIGIGRKQTINDQSLTRKKSSGSGRIIFRPQSRSNSNRDEDSLEK